MSKVQFLLSITAHLAKSRLPVVYIVGNTLLLTDQVKEKFEQTKTWLKHQGFHVICPIDFINPDSEEASSEAMTLLSVSDHICLQKDWETSENAKMEWAQALRMGIDVIFE